MRPLSDMFELIEHRETIAPIFLSFEKEFDRLLKKESLPSPTEIDSLIDDAIAKQPVELTEDQYNVVQAYFDTYLGAFHMSGKPAATVLSKMLLGI